jgi:hypothetical protein
MKQLSRSAPALLALAGLLVLAACAAGPNPAVAEAPAEPAGFLLGLWHGIILPVTFIVSLFTDSVSIYEVRNNGGWYDFGFILGVMIIFGSGGAGSRGRRR